MREEPRGPRGSRGEHGRPVRALTRALRARGPLLLGVLLAIVLTCASAASAIVLHTGGETFSYQPAPGARIGGGEKGKGVHLNSKSPLLYFGGPVMRSNTNYTFYWAPPGSPEYPAGYQSGVNRFFEDLAHDSGTLGNTDSVLVQYGDSSGEAANYDSHFGGALIDSDPYPANGCTAAPICLTDAQIRAELLGYIEARKLPVDLEHEYFVLTPPGVESCTESPGKHCSDGTSSRFYCAYHTFSPASGSALVYADDPYVDGLPCDNPNHPNANPSDSAINGGLAHEHSESVTDPELNAWHDSKGEEAADKCHDGKEKIEFGEPLGEAPDHSLYNQVIDGDLYYYQQIWSNATGECEQRAEAIPTISKVKPKNGPPAGGTTVTITGTGFTSPATVAFGEAQGTNVVVHSPTTITVESPAGGPKTEVPLRVSTSAGTSTATKKTQFKYKSK